MFYYTVVRSHGHECQAPEGKCDFICDCSDCSDEDNCGKTLKASSYRIMWDAFFITPRPESAMLSLREGPV